MESARDKAKNQSRVSKETERFKIWYSDLYMKKKTPRGSLSVKLKEGDNPDPYIQDDVKISDQNIKTFISTIKKAEDLEEEMENHLFSNFVKLKFKAKEQAQKSTSKAEHQEEKEELDVKEKEINEVLKPSYLFAVLDKTDKIHLGDYTLKAVSLCSALSKNLTGTPINLWGIGTSGAGKTHNFQTMFKAIPKEYKIKFDSCSSKALYYFTEKYDSEVFDGKVVLFNEVEASQEAKEVLRSITDPNEENNRHITVTDQESLEINIEGSPITWFTSVDPIEDGQLKNRFLFSNPEEGSEHHQEIAEHQQDNFRKGELQPIKKIDFPMLKAGYRKIIEETKDLNVVIPFKWKWNREKNPRLQPYFANLLYNIVKIHYRDRPILEGNIIATLDDYYLTKFIWTQIEEVTLDRVKDKDLNLLEHIPKKETTVTRSDLQEQVDWGYSTVKRALNRLADAGLIRQEKDNNQWKYQKISKGLPDVAIRLNKDYLDDKSILKELTETLNLATKSSIDEGVVCDKVLNPTPSYMNEMVARDLFDRKDFLSVLEREKDVINYMAIDGNLSERNKEQSKEKEKPEEKNPKKEDKIDLSERDLDKEDIVVNHVQDLDEGEGVEYQELFDRMGPENMVKDIISDLLSDGTFHEPRAGRLKVL